MAQKPGSVASLRCVSCPKQFQYTLTKSPFRPKFCTDCANMRTYENKKRFDERRKFEDVERARCRKALQELEDRDFNPSRMIERAMKMEI